MKRAVLLSAFLAVPAAALADDYSGMLAYLDVTRIDGRALAGASGAIAINQAAGDLNIQANLHGMASAVAGNASQAASSIARFTCHPPAPERPAGTATVRHARYRRCRAWYCRPLPAGRSSHLSLIHI